MCLFDCFILQFLVRFSLFLPFFIVAKKMLTSTNTQMIGKNMTKHHYQRSKMFKFTETSKALLT